MSLNIFPSYPKIRTDQLSTVDWPSISALTALITNTANQAVNDPNVANVLNNGNLSKSAVNSLIDQRVNSLISSGALAVLTYNGQVNGSGVDWNTLTNRGYYLVLSGGTGGTNSPPVQAQNGVLLVLDTGNGRVQLFFGFSGGRAIRYFDNGSTWTQWVGWSQARFLSAISSNINLTTSYQTIFSRVINSDLFAGASGLVFLRIVVNLTSSAGISNTLFVRIRSSSAVNLALSSVPLLSIQYSTACLNWVGYVNAAETIYIDARAQGVDAGGSTRASLVPTLDTTQASFAIFEY